MCLYKVDKTPRGTKGNIGYKVVLRYYDDCFLTLGIGGPHVILHKGLWEASQTTKPISVGNISYPSGFHMFTSKRSAVDYANNREVVVKVVYDGLLASGIQYVFKSQLRTIVAKRIKVIELVETDTERA